MGAARAGLKGAHFALLSAFYRLSGAWLNREGEGALLRAGSAEVPGLYKGRRQRMLLLHTQPGLAALGLNVELLS